MTFRTRRFSVLAIALVSMLALSATAAFAQYPPASAFGVSCTSAQPGGTLSCTVVGAQANEALTATASEDGDVFDTQNLNATAEGEVDFTVDVPTDVLGNVVVAVEGAESGSAADTVTVAQVSDEDDEDEVAGTPIAGSGSLPMTGGEVGVLLLVALTLIGGGLLALRRREDSKVTAGA